jgi:hypothetical protein
MASSPRTITSSASRSTGGSRPIGSARRKRARRSNSEQRATCACACSALAWIAKRLRLVVRPPGEADGRHALALEPAPGGEFVGTLREAVSGRRIVVLEADGWRFPRDARRPPAGDDRTGRSGRDPLTVCGGQKT